MHTLALQIRNLAYTHWHLNIHRHVVKYDAEDLGGRGGWVDQSCDASILVTVVDK
jgi:hypothetical protein